MPVPTSTRLHEVTPQKRRSANARVTEMKVSCDCQQHVCGKARVRNDQRSVDSDQEAGSDYAHCDKGKYKSTSGRRHRYRSDSSSSESSSSSKPDCATSEKQLCQSSGHRQSRLRHRSRLPGPDSSDGHRHRPAHRSASSSASRSRTRDAVKPDKYDGKGGLDTFLAKFEACADYNKWTRKDRAAHLKSALTGSAADLLQGNARATYSELVELLQRRYGNSEQQEVFKLELKSKRRKPGQDIQSLAHEVEKLVIRAYPRAPPDLRETLSIDSFIDALTDPLLQCRLREREPSNLNEAVSTALRLEAIALSTLRTDQTTRRHTRAAKVEMDEVHDEDCQTRPSSKAAGTLTSPDRGKASLKKARHSSTATERALPSQIQKQGKEICQLREMVSELSQAGTPPSTPSRVQQLPLPGQAVYTQPTYHVSPLLYGRPSAHECQQPCYSTPPKAASPIQAGSGFLPQCPALMATPSAQKCVPTAHGYPLAALGFCVATTTTCTTYQSCLVDGSYANVWKIFACRLLPLQSDRAHTAILSK